ncbi:MAG: DUF1501 domain-containing protein [Bacteroidetes bacterium]|nr:DUF1501 domain-containing protein [Bacteroidota bacterium]
MIISRRIFIAGSTSLAVAAPLSVAGMARAGMAARPKTNLVVVMLRGGMDAMTAAPFIGNDTLKAARPDLLVKKPISITGDFALHPKLPNFKNLWDEGRASVFHATSIPYTGRSHFEGQNLMESGGTKPYADSTGWLGRALEEVAGRKSLSISLPMPLILRGARDLDNFMPAKNPLPQDHLLDLLTADYADDPDLAEAMARIRKRPLAMGSMNGGGDDVETLARIAGNQLADPDGPSIAVFDIGGFDTHSAQGSDVGEHANQLRQFDQIIGTLRATMSNSFDNTIIVSLTEFGRTVKQNGGSGTEHGYGTAILMAGGLLPNSRILGDWPGLTKNKLYEGRDLNATIDARAVYAATLARVLNTGHKQIVDTAFFGADLPDLTKHIFA